MEGNFFFYKPGLLFSTLPNTLLLVAGSDLSIIIEGETGTGKTTLAQEIHNLSKRSGKPFVKLDVNALSESLVDSELFGHEKGSFTGADRKRIGFFEAASGGTILLDEIENISHGVQRKLLQVVEDKKVYLVGNTTPLKVDFRIIAATNANIQKLLKEKKFRQDLFYRLGEHLITIPPLRERPEDIKFFIEKFLIFACREQNHSLAKITEDAMIFLMNYSWPGNIRELKSTIKKAVILCEDGVITEGLIKKFLTSNAGHTAEGQAYYSLKQEVQIHEMKIIRKAMEICGGDKIKASSLLASP